MRVGNDSVTQSEPVKDRRGSLNLGHLSGDKLSEKPLTYVTQRPLQRYLHNGGMKRTFSLRHGRKPVINNTRRPDSVKHIPH